jgi:hypothetical protein
MDEKTTSLRLTENRSIKILDNAFETVEEMTKVANLLLESKLCPSHFYEKGMDNKPDYTKGKTAALIMVALHGKKLGFDIMTAMQQVVPVNGLMSVKGDGAKSLILNSGKIEPGSWKEERTGSIEDENLKVTITATRSDTKETLSRTFSVDQAKRAGLWITPQQASGQDGWKYKSSAWYKFPERLVGYRALGFLARDLFPDVMSGTYITEEARDIPSDTTEVIETESGAKITIPDKEHSKSRSSKMTDRVADKIPDNKFGEVKKDNIQDATVVDESKDTFYDGPIKDESYTEKESPFKAERGSVEYLDGKEVKRDAENTESKETIVGQWTLKEMEGMDTPILLKTVMEDMDMMEASEIIGGKNTNKKLREIIFAHQEGRLDAHVAPYLKKEPIITGDGSGNNVDVNEADTTRGEIPVNKEFDKAKEDKKIDDFLNAPPKKEEKKNNIGEGNKYNIEIPAETPREFSIQKSLYNKMIGLDPQITTPRYFILAEKVGLLAKYSDKEVFIKEASVSEINDLLNSN